MITADYAVGFIFQISVERTPTCTVKFTCDTGWSTDMEKTNREFARESLEKIADDDGKIDVLVAHIGSIQEKEFTYDTNKSLLENKDKLYKYHLGMIGCLACVNYWKPEIVLLSEFGQEMNAVRKQIAEKFTAIAETKFFATDLNFTIDLETRKVMCFHDRNFHDIEEISTRYKGKQLYFINENKIESGNRPEIDDWLGDKINVFVE